MAKDNGFTDIVDILEDFMLEERKTEIGKLLKDNRLKQYCLNFFKAGVKTIQDAVNLDLTDRFLKIDLDVRDSRDQEKIRKLLGQLKLPPKIVKLDKVETNKATSTSQNVTNGVIESLPDVPNAVPVLAKARAVSIDLDDPDDVPTATLVLE